jgi:hypothetical protein
MTMRNLIFPLLLVATVGVAASQYFAEEPPEKEMTVPLVATADIAPYLEQAARDLGHKKVRAYDGGVFINSGEETIAFYKTKQGMEMHVAFETEYRRKKTEREQALLGLRNKGESIYELAKSMQARSAAEGAFAAREAKSPHGG